MDGQKRIQSALISVFHKDGLAPIIQQLDRLGVHLYSTGGTQEFIESLGVKATPVEELTTYPSILGGRVKTLHPKVFGGILGRRDLESDVAQLEEYAIPPIDLVIVDLYPFEATVAAGGDASAIIEKIDIGGISLIRAAAKNHSDVVIVSAQQQYGELLRILMEQNGSTSLEQRKGLAASAFAVSSQYDGAIHNWFTQGQGELRLSAGPTHVLRYGENPHQKGAFHGDLAGLFEQLNGKELSYNNLLDLDAAVDLIDDLDTIDGVPFAILKHNNACGAAIRPTVKEAWEAALAGDPVSAFGGVLITTARIDKTTAEAIDPLFFEIIAAPAYDDDGLEVLKTKKNRMILQRKPSTRPVVKVRTALNGYLTEDADTVVANATSLRTATTKAPTTEETTAMVFANMLVKHTKSNAIVLAKGNQLLASGTGQTSRVDALEQAIAKAAKFNFDLHGAVMASDAFFPFPDCVEIAHHAGITAVVHPGGSIRDQDSIDFCNSHGMAMAITGTRHFKH
ncbi:MAG: bifunctional phosphoribosylaminoimidazolecarboxamide formyltransferase/IMP cyclohydrolase [Flavobacteriales bacterium]|nr:bifunctional phosphoribosylaminoimidazolecarboxamide formyltransferase/IMP cyclohydrolase [Flavobacteriales bacterium]MBK6550602.1 bifunctional phosphoribosylaminoimidazolecarboxamide formyltransferase/IMP cyclohydrolase [Flavobacteriales bacterium]MBK6884829.1 bifunctional phosphoribosylaminoimidazolecarboxamide formyltransferase/IMP cyclohydrolase [Flavobacteriales bacterium]MBK7102154.1 bifunctional phosphoribosylaminoimidazolecarboxamide formyltransferase/IMP cyclohydrolase [Flavobacteria